MVFEKIYVLFRQLFSVHFLYSVSEEIPVNLNKALFRKLTHQCSDVLLFNVGVGVELRSSSGVGCVNVIDQEIDLIRRLSILFVFLSVQDVVFCNGVPLVLHKRKLYSVLNVLDMHNIKG